MSYVTLWKYVAQQKAPKKYSAVFERQNDGCCFDSTIFISIFDVTLLYFADVNFINGICSRFLHWTRRTTTWTPFTWTRKQVHMYLRYFYKIHGVTGTMNVIQSSKNNIKIWSVVWLIISGHDICRDRGHTAPGHYILSHGLYMIALPLFSTWINFNPNMDN